VSRQRRTAPVDDEAAGKSRRSRSFSVVLVIDLKGRSAAEGAGPAGGELVGPVAGQAQQHGAERAAAVAGHRFETFGPDPGLGGLGLEPGGELGDRPGTFLGAAPGGHQQVDGHRRPVEAVL
jgi:hypothetical protein